MAEDAKPLPSSSSKRPYSLNLKNHCLICLKQQEPDLIIKLLTSNPAGIDTFQPVINYLTGSPHEDKTSKEKDGTGGAGANILVRNVPPLCTHCYDMTATISQLHRQLLDVQLKIQIQTEKVRKVVRGTTKTRFGECGRDGFLSKIACSEDMPIPQINLVNGFVKKLHDQIISQGNKQVYFPLHCFSEGSTTRLPPVAVTCQGAPPQRPTNYVSAFNSVAHQSNTASSRKTVKADSLSNEWNDLKQVDSLASVKSEIESTEEFNPEIATTEQFENFGLPIKNERSEDMGYNIVSQPGAPISKPTSTIRINTKQSTSKDLIFEIKSLIDFQKCDICGEKMPVGSKLVNHLKSHVGSDYVFYCGNCKHGFVSSFRLNTHHRNTKSSCRVDTQTKMSYQCTLCDFKTNNTRLYKKHFEDHEITSKEKLFYCPMCHAKFACKESVEIHLEGKHLCHSLYERQHCEVCQVLLPIFEMRQHLQKEHGIENPISCKLCFAQYGSIEKMIQHQTLHRKRSKIMSCHICDDKYTALRDFYTHYLTVHGIGQKYSCDKCTREFFSVAALERHQNKCHTPRPKRKKHHLSRHDCPDCTKTFSLAEPLLEHRIVEHAHPPITCPYSSCDKVFNRRSELRKHTGSAHSGISFCKEDISCDLCETSFNNLSSLRNHKLTKHGSGTSLPCETCGKKFKNVDSLRTHVRRQHLNAKTNFPPRRTVCDTCGKNVLVSRFPEHVRTHTKERPFVCNFNFCGQRFRQKISWKTHVRSHERLGSKFKPKGEMERGVRKSTNK